VSEIQGEGNFTAYNEVFFMYKVRDMLLSTVMCA